MRTREQARGLAAVAIAATITLAANDAHAGAFGLREQSAVGQGTSFAGAAAGGAGLGSMFWNPATITMNPGLQSETVINVILPYSTITQGAGSSPGYSLGQPNSGDLALDAVIPVGYGSWQVNDRLWIGISTNTPYGLSTKPDSAWSGRAYGSSTKVVSFEATPTIGYRINDSLSVGAGLRVLYFKVRYTSAFPQFGGGMAPTAPGGWPVLGLEGDSTGVGYTLGLTWKPMPGTEIGLGFRSAVEQSISGDFFGAAALGQAVYLQAPGLFGGGPAQAAAYAASIYNHPIKANVVLPETVTLGISHQLTPEARLLAGFEWTNWSRLQHSRVLDTTTGVNHGVTPYLPLDYKDGWFASLGGEYKLTPQWTARAGLAYESSPITTTNRSARLPDNDRIWASLGVGYQLNEKISFDLAYTHIFPMSTKLNIVPGSPQYNAKLAALGYGSLVGSVDSHVDVVSLSFKYKWDDPTKTIPVVRPAVVK